VAIGIFVFLSSVVVWLILAAVLGLRPTPEEEMAGLDRTEIGIEAYPDFGRGSQIA
jgi:Amt family ammonium transporter